MLAFHLGHDFRIFTGLTREALMVGLQQILPQDYSASYNHW